MKTLLKTTIFAFSLIVLGCSKDDSQEQVNQAPTVTQLISPSNGSDNVDLKPTFSWNAANDSDGDSITYEIYADTTENPITLIGVTTETSFELEERLSLLDNYNWKIIAKDGKGGETESQTQNFRTRTVIVSVATSDSGIELGVSNAVTFNNKVWFFDSEAIWNSSDGISWSIINNNPNYTSRTIHNVLVYNNKLWIIGGQNSFGSLINDVWNSIDGITWELVTDTPGFNNTSFTKRLVVFQNKIWYNTVEEEGRKSWFSNDGIVWSLAQEINNFSGQRFLVKDDKIYSFGTNFDSQSTKIVGSVSENGTEWTSFESLVLGSFSNESPEFIVYDNKFWVVGLSSDKILYSEDGIVWEEAGSLNKSLRGTNLIVKDDKIWVVGGTLSGGNERVNDVWFIN